MVKVLVCIANGSEELEAVTVIDLLRRAQADVTVAAVGNDKRVRASRGVVIEADSLMLNLAEQPWDLIVLPGGMPGAENLSNSDLLIKLVTQQIQANRWIAAICAAPAVVLGRHHLIKKSRATCFPSFQQELATQVKELSHDRVVIDHKLVTSQGPGTAMEFSLTLIELLFGHNKRNEIAAQLIY